MSIRIYNGYALREDVDPLDFVADLRGLLNPVRDQLDGQLLAWRTAVQIDYRVFGLVKTDAPITDLQLPVSRLASSAFRTFSKEQDELKAAGRTRSWGYDPHRFELSIGKDPATGLVVLMTHCEKTELREAFKALPTIREYAYWDNVDPLEDITEAQWEERGQVWERVVGNDLIGESTVQFQLRMDPVPMQWRWNPQMVAETAVKFQPTSRRRAETVALDFAAARLRSAVASEDLPHMLSRVMRSNLSAITQVIEPLIPALTAELFARRQAVLGGLITDEEIVAIWASVETWWNLFAAQHLLDDAS